MLKELTRNEAISFVNIATEFINVDQNVNVEEKEVLDKYLSLLNVTKDEVKNLDNETAINTLSSSSDRIKNIVYFELLGIALIDGDYENSEIDYLDHLATTFNISRSRRFAFANFYFDFDNIAKLSQEDKEAKVEALFK